MAVPGLDSARIARVAGSLERVAADAGEERVERFNEFGPARHEKKNVFQADLDVSQSFDAADPRFVA